MALPRGGKDLGGGDFLEKSGGKRAETEKQKQKKAKVVGFCRITHGVGAPPNHEKIPLK